MSTILLYFFSARTIDWQHIVKLAFCFVRFSTLTLYQNYIYLFIYLFIHSFIYLFRILSPLTVYNVIFNNFNTLSLYLRNRKHVPCFYRVIETRVEVWENEKCRGNTSHRQVFPQLFRVLECFYNSIETRRTCFLFLLENPATKKRKQLLNFYYQNVNYLSSPHHYVNSAC